MVKAREKTEIYQSYIRSVLRMFAFMDDSLFDSDEADVLREQMVEPWHALSKEERKRMDGLVMDLTELRKCRSDNGPGELTETQRQEGLMRMREAFDLKEAGKLDEALEHLRKWQTFLSPQSVWDFRGSCWDSMGAPEVGAEFHREARRLDEECRMTKHE